MIKKTLSLMQLENYPTSKPVPFGITLTLMLKHPQVKTPFTTHTGYATKEMLLMILIPKPKFLLKEQIEKDDFQKFLNQQRLKKNHTEKRKYQICNSISK